MIDSNQNNTKNQSVLAIIPARGGSKGIPHKNIYPVNGKPLISYTIEAALSSELIDVIVVSTDDDEIAQVASGYEKIRVIHRSASLAQDLTPTLPVLLDALDQLSSQINPGIIVTLQPTSPLRKTHNIDNAIRLLSPGLDSCVSVCEVEHTPYKMFTIQQGMLINLFSDIKSGIPRQLLPPVYRENGAIYISWTETLIRKNSIWGEKVVPYIMNQDESIDIDTILDIRLAEIILKESEENKK